MIRKSDFMEEQIELYSIEEERFVCGSHDRNVRALRSQYGVAFVSRDGNLKIIGDEEAVLRAKKVVLRILESYRSNEGVSEEDAVRIIDDAQIKDKQKSEETTWEKGRALLPPNVKPKSKGQEKYVKSISECDITFGIGPAGTGKTFLAVAVAVAELKEGLYRKLILVRPAVEAGEKLGFLPGDFQAKVNPYLRPLYDAIESFMEINHFKKYIENDVIEVVPLAYMRGRTLDRSFIILDEAQNTTPKQMKMFLTRMGSGSKIVITGDITQIDLPGDLVSGLIQALDLMKGIKGIGTVYLTAKDIFRHPLVQQIVKAYGRAQKGSDEPEPT